MAVSDDMRLVEQEIDERLKRLPLWRCARDNVLKATLDYYRDVHEAILIAGAAASYSGSEQDFDVVALELQRFQAGCFQVLKWTFLWCPERSVQTCSDEMIREAQDFGACYEALVDSLKLAKVGLVEIVPDLGSRQVTVYEGGDTTGADWSLVERQRRSNLFRSHIPLTEDGDQLTRAWTAAAYRQIVSWLSALAANAQKDTVTFTQPSGDQIPLFPRPVVVSVPEPPEPQFRPVLDDLTLSAARLAGSEFWRHVSWLDTPLVVVGAERLGPSDLLMALARIGREDHMLRLAAALDAAQYEKVSGLREGRMIQHCREVLEQEAWTVHPKYRLRHPTRELDIYAIRDGIHLVLELKSTLRPETPWEVYKRNEDILKGIAQAQDACARIGSGAIGAVITDGYRGDYSTWRRAIEHQIPIGTLEDIPDLARDPHRILELLKARVGFDLAPPEGTPFERSCDLVGWTLRFVDSQPPPHASA